MTVVETVETRGLARLVDRLAGLLDRSTSRRGFLSRVAVVGSAVAVSPVEYVLRPGTAYAAVCGNDASCSSGYTVFCATINNGVNRCPPNALVGGWWKADGSSFCCGSARYYIDCHSYCSCGCGGGASFCGPGCRSCNCGCGPSESCDQRRVCCNNFRYGQCNQDVGCTGPVWCRVVTCTPPWRIPQWKCTSTSATDNRTATHTSPALVGCTAVVQKYTGTGGPGGWLGEATTAERTAADGSGRFNDYDGGTIWWHPDTGAHVLYTAVRGRFYGLGAERGVLGYPTSDQVGSPDGVGAYAHFVGGDVATHPQHGTHAVVSGFRDAWYALGAETGALGYPTSDAVRSPDGVGSYTHFARGDLAWSPATGVHAVLEGFRDGWYALGAETGRLGYPTSDAVRSPDGVGSYTHFTGGDLAWSPRTGVHAVLAAYRDAWYALGAETGVLGYPSSDEIVSKDGVGSRTAFVGGDVYRHPTYGTHAVLGPVLVKYAALGRETGPLRYPATDQRSTVRSGVCTDFVGAGTAAAPDASVYWSPGTGAWSVSGPIRSEWLARGGPGGAIGFPVSDPSTAPNGVVTSTFEHAVLTYDPSTRSVTVTPR